MVRPGADPVVAAAAAAASVRFVPPAERSWSRPPTHRPALPCPQLKTQCSGGRGAAARCRLTQPNVGSAWATRTSSAEQQTPAPPRSARSLRAMAVAYWIPMTAMRWMAHRCSLWICMCACATGSAASHHFAAHRHLSLAVTDTARAPAGSCQRVTDSTPLGLRHPFQRASHIE